ncbi:MAG TPA: M15 family metallopeptidase [Candidatus Limnocylindrales bacterium]|nr:M15 family metallopeptidase [Candidatus Limnocylindrales bacterium]
MLSHGSFESSRIETFRFRSLMIYGLVVATAVVASVGLITAFKVVQIGPATPIGLPDCRIAERPARHDDYDDWATTLLDPARALKPSYRPPDLRVAMVHGQRVELRPFVIGPLTEMLDAAARDGVTIRVTSSFRSYEEQRQLVLESPGMDDLVARPGHSEHQLGTTVDLGDGAEWLALHAPSYGFVLSFPASRSPELTCYSPEPWHYRYFGRDRAAAIAESGLSPREWLWAEQVGQTR